LEEEKYAETSLELSRGIYSGLMKSSGAILRLNPNRRGHCLMYAKEPGNSRIAPENKIAESRTLDHQDGLQRLLDEQECCDYEGMMTCKDERTTRSAMPTDYRKLSEINASKFFHLLS
jgi:hypothetical protein